MCAKAARANRHLRRSDGLSNSLLRGYVSSQIMRRSSLGRDVSRAIVDVEMRVKVEVLVEVDVDIDVDADDDEIQVRNATWNAMVLNRVRKREGKTLRTRDHEMRGTSKGRYVGILCLFDTELVSILPTDAVSRSLLLLPTPLESPPVSHPINNPSSNTAQMYGARLGRTC